MANNHIVVPVRIEGKYLESERMVSPPLADFTKLPWNDGTQDIHFDHPFVGDGIIHQPFENPDLLLGAGVHLHFIVPHFLGRNIPAVEGLRGGGELPAAPNRWLITKTDGGNTTQWIIESDYIHHSDYKPDEPSCIIPFHKGLPFRYMGRKTKLNDSRPAGDTFKSLNNNNKPLTVTGYGDINFSSYYPNCLGVFGFHDPDGALSSRPNYSVLGWNADVEDDLLNGLVTALLKKNTENISTDIKTALKKQLHLDVELNSLAFSESTRTLFYGEIEIDSSPPAPTTTHLKIAVGNTGTEALSALMAEQLDPDHKKDLEEQLESVLLSPKLDHLHTDTGPKFLEARHEKGFRPSHAGHLWKIVTKHQGQTPDDAEQLPDLPPELAHALAQLNSVQQAFDQATREITTLRHQLYLDWYKYMHARYPGIEGRGQFPDADHIQYFIETFCFDELDNLVAATGQLTFDEKSNFQPKPAKIGAADLANQVLVAWTKADDLLARANTTRSKNKQPVLSLSMAAGPRYWEANAPAVLISGLNGGTDTQQTGPPSKSGPLPCQLLSSDQVIQEKSLATQNPGDILSQCKGDNTSALSKQQWAPFILDWEVDLIDTHMQPGKGAFSPDGLKNNFDINPFGPDFQKNSGYQAGDLSVFSGTVLMSSHAKDIVLSNIEAFVTTTFKKQGISFTGKNTIKTFFSAQTWEIAYGQLAGANPALKTAPYASNPLRTIRKAYHTLSSDQVISQTLNGFNHACIMRKKTAQLPIAEPIGFAYAKDFTRAVKDRVLTDRDSSPVTAFDFNPLRCGAVTFNRLNLIDNFGLVTKIIEDQSPKPTYSESLVDAQGDTFLKPRLAQPARLNFRWLSANPADGISHMETNDHPHTSPVCGWLVANYLDNSLAVFSADGTAAGYIDASAAWNTLPWSDQVTDIQANISNLYLQQVVARLCSGSTFFNNFLTATQAALNNIAPHDAHLHDIKSVLMGRPMAVVRARVSFQLKGLPAIDQSWPALLTDLHNCSTAPTWSYKNRHKKNWTDIKLPVRLGEHAQLNDGLVGYWTEGASGELSDEFMAPETSSADVSNPDIDTWSGSNHQVQWLAINDAPLNVTMLVDPRGVVHATTGLLPVKAISIDPLHYLDALKKMGMWFYTSPLLQPAGENGKLLLNLPPVPGYKWQWWDPFQGNVPVNPLSKDHMHAPSNIKEGWLSLIPNKND